MFTDSVLLDTINAEVPAFPILFARLETQAIEETQGGNTEEEIAEEKDNLNTLYIRDPDHEQSGNVACQA